MKLSEHQRNAIEKLEQGARLFVGHTTNALPAEIWGNFKTGYTTPPVAKKLVRMGFAVMRRVPGGPAYLEKA